MSGEGNYEIIVIRSKDDIRILKSGLSKKEAEVMKEDWENVVFNKDTFFEPVPKLKVRVMGD